MPKKISGLPYVWVSLIVVIIDQVVKFAVVSHLVPYQPFVLTPFFSLYLAFNRGAAFSVLSTESGWQLWLFSLIAIVICVLIVWWLSKLRVRQRWLCVALALILGGAIGNLVDRLTLGYVIDYFLFHIKDYAWPAFNVADTAISIGAIMMVVDVCRGKRKKHDKKD